MLFFKATVIGKTKFRHCRSFVVHLKHPALLHCAEDAVFKSLVLAVESVYQLFHFFPFGVTVLRAGVFDCREVVF